MAVSANTQTRVTADTDVTTVSSVLRSVVLTPDGTNACSVIVKDGTAAAGTAQLSLATAGTGPSVIWTGAAVYASGIGVDVTGTGVAVTVEYDQD